MVFVQSAVCVALKSCSWFLLDSLMQDFICLVRRVMPLNLGCFLAFESLTKINHYKATSVVDLFCK